MYGTLICHKTWPRSSLFPSRLAWLQRSVEAGDLQPYINYPCKVDSETGAATVVEVEKCDPNRPSKDSFRSAHLFFSTACDLAGDCQLRHHTGFKDMPPVFEFDNAARFSVCGVEWPTDFVGNKSVKSIYLALQRPFCR